MMVIVVNVSLFYNMIIIKMSNGRKRIGIKQRPILVCDIRMNFDLDNQMISSAFSLSDNTILSLNNVTAIFC